jgi:hypothetical protein
MSMALPVPSPTLRKLISRRRPISSMFSGIRSLRVQ